MYLLLESVLEEGDKYGVLMTVDTSKEKLEFYS